MYNRLSSELRSLSHLASGSRAETLRQDSADGAHAADASRRSGGGEAEVGGGVGVSGNSALLCRLPAEWSSGGEMAQACLLARALTHPGADAVRSPAMTASHGPISWIWGHGQLVAHLTSCYCQAPILQLTLDAPSSDLPRPEPGLLSPLVGPSRSR